MKEHQILKIYIFWYLFILILGKKLILKLNLMVQKKIIMAKTYLKKRLFAESVWWSSVKAARR